MRGHLIGGLRGGLYRLPGDQHQVGMGRGDVMGDRNRNPVTAKNMLRKVCQSAEGLDFVFPGACRVASGNNSEGLATILRPYLSLFRSG